MEKIKNYENYLIDKNGNIFSVLASNGSPRKKLRKLSWVAEGRKESPYWRVKLKNLETGKLDRWLVHRLVAIQFIDNPQNKPIVNHIDGNKSNNSISNLEWCTYKENARHAENNGLSYHPKGKEWYESRKRN